MQKKKELGSLIAKIAQLIIAYVLGLGTDTIAQTLQ